MTRDKRTFIESAEFPYRICFFDRERVLRMAYFPRKEDADAFMVSITCTNLYASNGIGLRIGDKND